MQYFIYVDNGIINGCGNAQYVSEGVINVNVTAELFNDYLKNPEKYIYSDGEIILNPNCEQEQVAKRREQFNKDFFNTSLGYIRRKVSMKTGETKDFLTDLLPVISLGVQSGQTVNLITYRPPDFTQEDVDWESLQTIKQATPNFIQECYTQVNKDFTGV